MFKDKGKKDLVDFRYKSEIWQTCQNRIVLIFLIKIFKEIADFWVSVRTSFLSY